MAFNPKNSLIFIFITMLLDVVGLGIIIPVLPSLIEELIKGNLSDASRYGGWLMFAYAFMQFLFSPVLGALSDKYGRRPILLASLFGFGIDYLFLAFAPSIGWLFVGRIIAGIMGASFTTASAFIADISTPEKRAQNFGLIGMAFGVGFIIGPMLGGLLGHLGNRAPFIASAALSFINCVYGYFILPESLPLDNRREFEWKRANPLGSLLQLKKYPVINGFLVTLVLIYIAGHSPQSTWSYYTMEKFNWTEAQVGFSLGFVGLTVAIVQGGLIRIAIPKLGKSKAVIAGLIFYCIGYILFSLATEGWMMYAFMIPYALGGICGPSLQGIMSEQVPANQQGELQGGLTSLMSVTSIVGPALMTNLFAFFTSKNAPVYFPGAPFMLSAVLILVSIALTLPVFKK